MFQIRRSYHSKHKFLRLLDYGSFPNFPAKLKSKVDSNFLLRSRANIRYGETDSKLEEATVLVAYFKLLKNTNPELREVFKSRFKGIDLDSEESKWQSNDLGPTLLRLAKGNTKSQLEAYAASFLAPNFTQAMEAMKDYKWPPFLVLYSLNREFSSRLEAYHAIRLYLRSIEDASPAFQIEMTALAIGVAQRHIVEMAPPVCEIFAAYASTEAKTPAALNELLWVLAKFGTTWTKSESLVLVAAQEVLVKAIGRTHLDMKGRVGLALTVLPSSRETALNLIKSPEVDKDEFAYRAGPKLVEMLASKSTETILGTLSTIDPKYRTPRVWSAALLSLRNHGLLESQLAEKLWRILQHEGVKPTQQLCELLLWPLVTTRDKISKIASLRDAGIEIDSKILACFYQVSSKEELVMASRYVDSFGEIAESPIVLRAKLAAEAKFNKNAVWDTYCKYLEHSVPTSDILESLCSAAWAPVVWDGLYAVQRVIPEIKSWVRQKAEDVLLLYPTQRLVYAYVFMLGKAQYDEELLDVLPWLEELNFSPDKRILCALIHYSSHGQALLRLGAKAEGEWPTPGELDEYAQGLAERSKMS